MIWSSKNSCAYIDRCCEQSAHKSVIHRLPCLARIKPHTCLACRWTLLHPACDCGGRMKFLVWRVCSSACVGDSIRSILSSRACRLVDPSGLVKTGPTRIEEICVGVPTWHQAGPSQQHPLPPPSPLKLVFNLQCSHRGTHTQAVQAVGEVHTGMLQPVQRSTTRIMFTWSTLACCSLERWRKPKTLSTEWRSGKSKRAWVLCSSAS